MLIHPFLPEVIYFMLLSLQLIRLHVSNWHTFIRNNAMYKLETWYTHGQWLDASCIPESSCWCLFVPLPFYFLSLRFQTLHMFVILFRESMRPRKMKPDIHMDTGLMHRLYQYQVSGAYLSIYFVFFLSLQFLKHKVLVTFSLEVQNIEIWYALLYGSMY